ncbi:MAG TPA: polysaccharide deacetylase family protein [Longimicrobiales bacterium]
MANAKPLASISLDTDNLWSYMKTHGEPGWESRPSYLDTLIPLALDVLDELELKITFFLVGVDAERAENGPALRALVERGHEVGNHSFEHEPWLHLYTREQLEAEIGRAEQAIHAATGQRPRGFRGPGFSWSPVLFEVLRDHGYLYDASTLPTFLGPLARLYYFRTARLSPEERAERKALFGTFRDGLRPIRPYRWRLDSGRALLEIPVTTFPILRVPIHLSYLLYLSRFSERLMFAYLGAALAACRLTRTEPSFLLHPLDLLSGERVPQLRFFPGMDVPESRKLDLFRRVLRKLGARFELVPMSVHARALLGENGVEARRSVVPAVPAGTRAGR